MTEYRTSHIHQCVGCQTRIECYDSECGCSRYITCERCMDDIEAMEAADIDPDTTERMEAADIDPDTTEHAEPDLCWVGYCGERPTTPNTMPDGSTRWTCYAHRS